MTGRLRVAVVQAGGMLGGAERWQLNLADATDRLEVSGVALGDGATADAWRDRGWQVEVVGNPARPTSMPGLALAVRRALRRCDADVVLAHGVKAALVAGPAARALGIPFVWMRHDSSFQGRIAGAIDRLSDAQISTSAWLLEGATPTRPVVINPPRMAPPMVRDLARAQLGLPVRSDRPILGMAARLSSAKGIDDAIRAVALPAAVSWDLAIAGIVDPSEPGEGERLAKLAADLGVTSRVHFLGQVPDVAAVMSAFDAVGVLTRPTEQMPWFREAFGMAALEALTAGVPVVAAPPVDELVGAGGIAVGAGQPADVAAALAQLADPARRSAVSEQARRRSLEFADAPTAADRLVDLLASVAHRPGAGVPGTTPLSIVTTVLDDADGLRELLDRLVPQMGPADELVVVDGGSTDGTHDLIGSAGERDPRIRLIVEPGAGISRGRNIGIAAAANEHIACTDAGCVPVAGWLDAFRAAVSQCSDASLFTGTYRVVADAPWERALAAAGYPLVEELARPTPLVRVYGRLLGRSFDATMPTGRSVAFTREAWQLAGGFPEHLQTGEDVTFGRAIAAAGGRAVLVRDAEVSWAQRPTLRSNLTMYRRYGEGSGNSLDPRLLGRDLARVGAYSTAAMVAVRGSRTARLATLAGTAAYLSLPMVRALRGPQPLRSAAWVPPVTVARDVAKAYGAVSAAARQAGARR
ncbi:glycosyltransferase [Nocardioides montaniterrae]